MAQLPDEAPSKGAARRPGRAVSRRERARVVGAAAVGVALTVFAMLNLGSVRVNWLFGTWSTPLIIVILLAFALGMGFDRLLVRRSVKARRAAKRAAR
ncbi:MAG TPA: hypothetical protein VNS09_16490 [Solirubrobacter sp.]|nr:hypothetical protein [Solirubrobacter sp.]